MEPVRVVAIGTGGWASVLAEAARRAGGITFVGGLARSADRRVAFVARYGGRPYETYDAVLADPAVEAVLVTTPHSVHAEQVIAAAHAGKHVFVDKPFALSAADARRATQACRRAGVVLAVGHQRRRSPANRQLKKLLDDGTLGLVAQIEGNMSVDGGFRLVVPGAWRADPGETPGGPMTNLGIHHVDTFQYLLGPIARVTALSTRLALPEVAVEDVTSVLFEFASGTLGYLGTSWVHANRTSVISVHGTQAQAWSEGDGTRLFVAPRGQPERKEVALPSIDPVVDELAEFARCVRNGGQPEVSGEEATAAIAVLDAIVASIRTERTVTLDGKEGPR